MTPLRIGLIGTGKHGQRYARHICNDLKGIALLAALARRDRDKGQVQAAEFGCRAYADYRELIAAGDVEAVVAVVPPTLLPEICREVVAARKPALFEKPAAPSIAAAREMLALVNRTGAAVMVAQTLRYNSVVRAIAAAIGDIGRIHALRLSQRFEPSPLTWIDVPEISGGGMILHTGVHSFDLVRVLSGQEAKLVFCQEGRVVTRSTEDNYLASIRLEGGTLASVAGSRATRSRTGPIEVVGAGGLLQGDHVHGIARRITGTAVTPLSVAAPTATVKEVLLDFVGALRQARAMPIPLIEGLRAAAVADACYRSIREGRPVAAEEL